MKKYITYKWNRSWMILDITLHHNTIQYPKCPEFASGHAYHDSHVWVLYGHHVHESQVSVDSKALDAQRH